MKTPRVSAIVPALFVAQLMLVPISASASITIVAREIGSDVVFEWGGPGQSIPLYGSSLDRPPALEDTIVIRPSSGYFTVGALSREVTWYSGNGGVGPISVGGFGSGAEISSFMGEEVTVTGAPFGIFGLPTYWVPKGYVSGSTYPVGSATIHSTNFSDLGIDPSESVTLWSFTDGNTVSMSFESVPEPSAGFMLVVAGLALVVVRQR